uniref:F-box associated domain-containing protein n=1 Tax=Leersia perrieri TaxID=77586 RepID=A0A0D9W2J3_9ORYZ
MLILLTYINGWCYFICNPTTRQYAQLLLYRSGQLVYEDLIPGDRHACYVYTLGSSDMPRCIGWPGAKGNIVPVLLHGSLHWYKITKGMILVFDTTAESFRYCLA